MFITGSQVIAAVTGEQITAEALGGAAAHNAKSGCAHFTCDTEQSCIDQIRALLSYLPQNNREATPVMECTDELNRVDESLNDLVPDSPNKSYDMMELVRSLADNGKILEYQARFAPNILTCLIRMGGRSVGVIASQPKVMAGCLDINASDKASRFIRTCDSFNIPLLTLEDVPGFLSGSTQEHSGIIRHGAKMLYAYSEATVPKITVITRKAYGGAYIGMCSKHLGADVVLAWPDAEIAVMGASGVCNIIFSKEIKGAADPQLKRQEKVTAYQDAMMNPYVAAARGYEDDVIMPEQTRQRVIGALFALEGKQESRPRKKHGNIPL